jgi:hypothetical protein
MEVVPDTPGKCLRSRGRWLPRGHLRDVRELDQVDVAARGLAPNAKYHVYALRGDSRTKLLTVRSDDTGTIAQALAFVEFFDNAYDRVTLAPAGKAAAVTAQGHSHPE